MFNRISELVLVSRAYLIGIRSKNSFSYHSLKMDRVLGINTSVWYFDFNFGVIIYSDIHVVRDAENGKLLE